MIESEDDVRSYVREASGGKARWVEPALGSTPGLPDCWVPYEDRQVHLELKCGSLDTGLLRFTVRPEQRREIRKMIEDKVNVGFLVGLKDTDLVFFIRPSDGALAGLVDISRQKDKKMAMESKMGDRADFWSGVYFIFF